MIGPIWLPCQPFWMSWQRIGGAYSRADFTKLGQREACFGRTREIRTAVPAFGLSTPSLRCWPAARTQLAEGSTLLCWHEMPPGPPLCRLQSLWMILALLW